MNKKILILSLLVFGIQWSSYAQTGFATLPAREKTRLAQEEEKASEQDAEFQKLMSIGMNHFESNEFEEAIKVFEQAGDKRPLNVYPPVMVEDVKLAMALYVEPEKKEEPKKEPKSSQPEDNSTADERVALMYEKEMAKVHKGTPPKPKVKDPEKEALKNEVKRDGEGMIIFESEAEKKNPKEVKEEVKVKAPSAKETETVKVEAPKQTEDAPKTEKEIQAELGAAYPDGITEKVFKEGNKEVTQRIVVKNKLGNEYRMVKHPWGGVFYFKNGTSVTQRVWDEETKK